MRYSPLRMRPGTLLPSVFLRSPGQLALAAIAFILALLLWAASLAGSAQSDEKPNPSESEEETDIQMLARQKAESIKLATVIDGKRQELEMLEQPVLRFGDIPRANDKGSVWIWQRQGRPQAIMELYRGADGRSWVHVIYSLAAEAITGDFGDGAPAWATQDAGIKWEVFDDAPSPSERPSARARQIKELAQKFTADEFWDPNNSRYELRLLIQPVHKYGDQDSALIDGAVFLLCHETNPEVVLSIEAVKNSGADAKFRYALARLGHADMHVEFAGKEV